MNNAVQSLRADHLTIERFISFYEKHTSIQLPDLRHPEDLSDTPADARIDAIYSNTHNSIHLEHTSIDFIVSGKTNKRSLDPGFLIIENELKKVVCPNTLGVNLSLSFEYAKDIPRLRRIAPELAARVTEYIKSTNPIEWSKYPRKSDILTLNGWEFYIRPDVLRGSEVKLQWSGSDDNFLAPSEIEKSINSLIPPKIAKLDCSLSLSTDRSIGILIVETNDIAAESFHSRCGMFARTMASLSSSVSEIWGLHGNSEPTLVWSESLDKSRLDCAYSDDPAYRTYAEIQAFRMRAWATDRRNWHENYRPATES